MSCARTAEGRLWTSLSFFSARRTVMTSEIVPPLSDDRLFTLGAGFVLALMSSASTDKIRPLDWWPRARAALETAAGAKDWPRMVSRAAAKLQIDVLHLDSVRDLSSIEVELRSADSWNAFRRICSRDSIYVVALAQMERDIQRETQS